MPKAKQFSVSHENRPGMLAEIAKTLGDQKINILSCFTTTSGTEGTTHLLVDNVNKAKKALAAAQLSYTEADVLHVELPNKPGALGKFAMKLADNNINITSGYATGGKRSKRTTVVPTVSGLAKAARIRSSVNGGRYNAPAQYVITGSVREILS